MNIFHAKNLIEKFFGSWTLSPVSKNTVEKFDLRTGPSLNKKYLEDHCETIDYDYM